ncbi:hypothetical protein M9H77_28868 [Catharanthus roseus]|uniref:Uncharacterized protein n=1 Tax=Catharanthus roseus TaxID=4058 RepID=A0ACC0AI68_CATRO|nr:hypothetical protein M9H77_28868 [Catharanthus roseus]
MQDIHAIGGGGGGGAVAGGGGRLFASGTGGGDRRLRPHHNQNQQALKCPRCDSLNTKFCYYNNYNLSQPRHFCKSCRRYWTKGGVLRNVPVGGGCRKTKRSKPKPTVSSDAAAAASAAAPSMEHNSNSHSSSESSSLTATTTAAKNTATTAGGSSGEVASATVNSSNTSTNLLSFQNSARFFASPQQFNASSSFDQQQQQLIDPSVSSNGQMFQEIGSFTSLMTSSNDPSLLGYNVADVSTYRLQQNHHAVDDRSSNQMMGSTGEDDLKMEPINCGFLDQTAQIGFSGLHQGRMNNGGLGGLDWQMNGGGGGDQGLFDFTGTVDQTYWGQNQWGDNDQSLNFPPLV